MLGRGYRVFLSTLLSETKSAQSLYLPLGFLTITIGLDQLLRLFSRIPFLTRRSVSSRSADNVSGVRCRARAQTGVSVTVSIIATTECLITRERWRGSNTSGNFCWSSERMTFLEVDVEEGQNV